MEYRIQNDGGGIRADLPDVAGGGSIAANIAEGFMRRGKADKARFMNIAEGSVEECQILLNSGE